MTKKRKGVLSNILFYLGIWAKTFPGGLALIALSVPLTILAIYSQIRIPQILIRGIERGEPIKTTFLAILLTFLLMMVCKIIAAICDTKIKTRGSRPMIWLYAHPINDKLFNMPYQQLISSEVQNKLAKIETLVIRGGDGGPIHFVGVKLSGLLISIVGMIVFTRDIVKIAPLLLLFILLSTLAHLAYGVYAGRYSERNMQERSQAEKKENYVLKTLENRHFSKDIRLFNLLNPLKKLFGQYHAEHTAYLRKEANVQFGSDLIGAIAVLARDILSYAFLASQLIKGQLLISDFVFLSAIVIQFSVWMHSIVQNANDLILFSAQMEQVRDFIDMKIENDEGSTPAEAVSAKPVIEFKNISYHYPGSDKVIFENFNLTIAAGEKLALVGINGAGKTTLMHLLMGLLEPSSGEILIDGKARKSFSTTEYYKLFSPVFQDITVFPETIAVNIAGGPTFSREKVQQVIEKAGFADFINGLENKEDTKLVRDSSDAAIDLSGGMNQRMLLARALYKNAPINILDEPTAALDPIAESRIYKEYDSMSQNKTSIFISHRLASTFFCDRIIFLENGTILEEGTHQDLMALGGNYYEMYQAQSVYYQEEEKKEACHEN